MSVSTAAFNAGIAKLSAQINDNTNAPTTKLHNAIGGVVVTVNSIDNNLKMTTQRVSSLLTKTDAFSKKAKDIQKSQTKIKKDVTAIETSLKDVNKFFGDSKESTLAVVGNAVALRGPDSHAAVVSEMAHFQRAQHLAYAASASTESIIGAARTFQDPESSPAQKAASVLQCISSVSQFAAVLGPFGVAGSMLVSSILGLISSILEATSPPRKSMMEQLESLMRDLTGEATGNELRAAHSLLNRQMTAIQQFDDGAKTWEEILVTAPLTSGISQFKVEVASEWLRNTKNQSSDKWEDVFVAYSNALVEVLALYVTVQSKLVNGDKKVLAALLVEVGNHVQGILRDLAEQNAHCADCWHVGGKTFGYFTGDLVKETKWQDINIGNLTSFVVGKNDRIWSANTNKKLATGKPGAMAEIPEVTNCKSVCIVDSPTAGTTYLLVVGTDKTLQVTKVVEPSGTFYTSDQVKNARPTDFAKDFWPAKIGGLADVLDVCSVAWTSDENTDEILIYVLRGLAGAPTRARLECLTLNELLESRTSVVRPRPVLEAVQGEGQGITASKGRIFRFSDGAISYKAHSGLSSLPADWTALNLPPSCGKILDVAASWDEMIVVAADAGMYSGYVDTRTSRWMWTKLNGWASTTTVRAREAQTYFAAIGETAAKLQSGTTTAPSA